MKSAASTETAKVARKFSSRIDVEAHLPMIPNFIMFGTKYEIKVPVSQLPKKVLRQIGQAWTDALVSRGKDA